MEAAPRTVLFEPWGLGDALIAAATLREAPAEMALACQSRWHRLLRESLADVQPLNLLSADLAHIVSHRPSAPNSITDSTELVVSIRGDLRDWLAAQQRFPCAVIRMNGWLEFAARRSALVDRLYVSRWLRIRNRYAAWAELAGIPKEQINEGYAFRFRRGRPDLPVVIHIGAHWQSKQYPHVDRLRNLLEASGRQVRVVGGPGDRLPANVSESQVFRAADETLVQALRGAGLVIANDSGPMHLAALLGCATLLVARAASVEAWLPPGVQSIVAAETPRGHRPDRRYSSQVVLGGWPAPDAIIEGVRRAEARWNLGDLNTTPDPECLGREKARALHTIHKGKSTVNCKSTLTSET